MFSSLSVGFCLSVCLLRTNGYTDFNEIFRGGGTWYKEQLGKFSGCSIKPLEHRDFFFTFSEESMPFSSIAEKNSGTDFHGIFRKGRTWHKEQSDSFIELKHFPRYLLLCGKFAGHRWIPQHKGQWRGALMFSLICAWITNWVNSREAGDLRRLIMTSV